MKNRTLKTTVLALTTIFTLGLTACGSTGTNASQSAGSSTASQSTEAQDSQTEDVKTIYYAFTTTGANSYIDESGNPDGYEFAAVNAIFDKLPQYKLEYVPTSDEDLLVGLESGKYDIGTKGAW